MNASDCKPARSVSATARNLEQRAQLSRQMKSLVLFPYTFVLMNWAAVVGLYHFLRGQQDVWSGYDVVASPSKENQLTNCQSRRDEFYDFT
jgi:hypothetical protein